MSYTIEHGVPMPKGRNTGLAFPWAEMSVGDSILVEEAHASTAATSASTYGKKAGKKFQSAKAEGGRRIWRVA